MSDLELHDGRNISDLGILEGEASDVHVRKPAREFPGRAEFHELPDAPPAALSPTYYEEPVLKEPVWKWMIPTYFYVGGAAGATSLLSATAQLIDPNGLSRIVKRGRYLGAAGDALSAGLLIADLGKPSRFLNMLRVFRATSPMSVGTWILSASGAFNTIAALTANSRGALGAVGNIANVIGGLLGAPLAGYTGVLLANTAVPFWQRTRRALPIAFMASGVAASASLFELMPDLSEREARVIRRWAIAGKTAELASAVFVEREAARAPRAARPLRRGSSSVLFRAAAALTAASLVASLWPKPTRRSRTAAGVLGTLGSLALRFAIERAGTLSARDPRATFESQRAGFGARESIAPAGQKTTATIGLPG